MSSWLFEDGESCRIVWRNVDDCHFGGYAKSSPELSDFVAQYSGLHNIPQPITSGILFWWLNCELQSGQLQEGAEVILIHAGGIFPDSNP